MVVFRNRRLTGVAFSTAPQADDESFIVVGLLKQPEP